MNIVNKLTVRQLKENKKRTMVTVIGVIISVAMITAVATLGLSFMDMMRRQTIADDGEWHVLYENVNRRQLEAIESDEETKSVMLSKDLGYAKLENGKNSNKPYLFVKAYDQAGLTGFPIHITEGRLPQSPDEIVVPVHVATNGKVQYHLGDVLELDVGERYNRESEDIGPLGQTTSFDTDKEGNSLEILRNTRHKRYTVVGFMERPEWEATWAPGYTVVSYYDENTVSDTERFHASVTVKKINRALFDKAEKFAEENEIGKVSFNNTLLRTYGIVKNDNMQSMLNVLTAIIMSIIMVGSISLIYNAFAISVSERSRYLGMLSSVGATKKQKRNSVFFEGTVIGAVSIPIGIVCGLCGIGITFACINSLIQGAFGVTEDFRLTVSPLMIAGTILLSALTIFISTYIPARCASRVTPIDAIRQTGDVKLTGKTVKTTKLTRKIFGIEAELGLKNLKRNKRRYKATVFSLIISLVLFLSVSYFSTNLKKSLALTQDGYNFDIQITGRRGEGTELFHQIAALDGVTKASSLKRLDAACTLTGNKLPAYLKQHPQYQADREAFEYMVEVYALDNTSMEEYTRSIGVDARKMKDLSCIVIERFQYGDSEQGKYVEAKPVNLSRGDILPVAYMDSEKGQNIALGELTVLQTTDQFPMGVMPIGNNAGFQVIVGEDVFHKLAEKIERKDIYTSSYLCLQSKDPMKLQTEIEGLRDASETNSIYIFNTYQMRQQEEQLMMLLTVFVYGFIILITAICIANIFNTISTSIALRKREFAMLKSVGMTPKGFNKMIHYESIFYGIKALLYGLPASVLMMLFIYYTLTKQFNFGFMLPWTEIAVAMIAVFLIVSAAMLYSISKVKKENIIDALKQENI